MPTTDIPPDDITAGQVALNRADWAAAAAAFERSLAAAETPAAHDGLGIALWWLNDIDAAHRHRARAFAGYREQGAFGRAARIACWLAREQLFLDANVPAMRGWFSRAESLIQQSDDGQIEAAWLSVLRASVAAPPHDMIPVAAEAVALARHAGDRDLEAFALAFHGQALATLGRVGDGMSRLDEAMTMATGGEVADLNIISEIFCVMLSTCEVAGDLTRSDLWCRRALEFARHYNCHFLAAYCRTAYGGLMTALGRWGEAEAALLEAIHAFERGHRGLRPHAVIKLADLRVRQGRLEEAELLLIGMEDQRAAVAPLARLYLRRGQMAQARAILQQSLPDSGDLTLDFLPVLFLLVEVSSPATDSPATNTGQIMATLAQMAERSGSELFAAQIEYLKGRISFESGDFSSARSGFEAALRHLRVYEQSLLAGQVRLRMAELLAGSDPPGAVAWATGALATFERIGAEQEAANASALLRRLGVTRSGPIRPNAVLTQREAEIAALIALGLSNRDIAERLVISPKTVEHHVGRILDKLGLRNRTEVAALAAAGRLGDLS